MDVRIFMAKPGWVFATYPERDLHFREVLGSGVEQTYMYHLFAPCHMCLGQILINRKSIVFSCGAGANKFLLVTRREVCVVTPKRMTLVIQEFSYLPKFLSCSSISGTGLL